MTTAANVIKGRATVYFCTAGTTVFSTSTFTNVGYTQGGGFKLTISRDIADIEVDQETVPIDWEETKANHKIEFTFAEVTLANLARALGYTASTSALTLSQDIGYAALAMQVAAPPIGTNTSNSTRTYLYPDVMPDSDVVIAAGEKGAAQNVPASFRWFKRRTQLPTATDA